MVEHQLPKLITRVRFPSPAPMTRSDAAVVEIEGVALRAPGKTEAKPARFGRVGGLASTATLVSVALAIVASAALPGCGSDPPPPRSEPSSAEPGDPDASATPSQPDPPIDAGISERDSTADADRSDNPTTTTADDGSVSGTSDSERSDQFEQETTPAETQESEQSTEAPSTADHTSTSQPSETTETDETGRGAAEPPDLGSAAPTPDTSGSEVAHLAYKLFGGGTETLGRYHGRPLVVNFFSSSCPPCIVEMPDFQQVYERLGDEVAFLGLSVDPGRLAVGHRAYRRHLRPRKRRPLERFRRARHANQRFHLARGKAQRFSGSHPIRRLPSTL